MTEINRCESCKWWDSACQKLGAQSDTTGLCRYQPPRADDRDHGAVWPFTQDMDWCGGWSQSFTSMHEQTKENRVEDDIPF